MTDEIFEVRIYAWDMDSDTTCTFHRIYGQESALHLGLEAGACDNVSAVEVVNIFTGELMLSIENQEVTWMAN